MSGFAWPWMFALLPLPWLLRRWWPPLAPAAALRLPHALSASPEGGTGGWRSPAAMAWIAVWLCLVAAAARPQWIGPPQPLQRSGRAMMLAVDMSGSMSWRDMRLAGVAVSRFAAVRAIAGDFIDRRDGDQVGLILFGSRAYLVTPPTFDLDAVRAQLHDVAVGLAGRETAIGDAIGVAVRRLRTLPAHQRVLVLLTDGVNTAGSIDPGQAAKIAARAGVRIYTIGIGAERMRVQDFFGSHLVNPSADLDVDMLTRIARDTGGRFFRATDSAELADAYRRIDALEPGVRGDVLLRPRRELYPWPLAAGLLLALAALWAAARSDSGAAA